MEWARTVSWWWIPNRHRNEVGLSQECTVSPRETGREASREEGHPETRDWQLAFQILKRNCCLVRHHRIQCVQAEVVPEQIHKADIKGLLIILNGPIIIVHIYEIYNQHSPSQAFITSLFGEHAKIYFEVYNMLLLTEVTLWCKAHQGVSLLSICFTSFRRFLPLTTPVLCSQISWLSVRRGVRSPSVCPSVPSLPVPVPSALSHS